MGRSRNIRNIPNGKFGDAVPRAGNASGGGQPGWILKCKGWETDPNAYIYFITQAPVWDDDLQGDRQAGMDRPIPTMPRRERACRSSIDDLRRRSRKWTMTKTKFEAMEILNQLDIPVRPDPVDEGIAEEPSLRETGTVVEVDHPKRGKYLTVGNPIKLSDSPDRGRGARRCWASQRRDSRRGVGYSCRGGRGDHRLGRHGRRAKSRAAAE